MMWRKSPTHFNMAAAFRRRKDILTKLSDLENDSDYYCSNDDDDDDEYMAMYRDYNFLCDNDFICEAMACSPFQDSKSQFDPAAPPALIHPKNYQLLPKTMSSALASAPRQISTFSKEKKKVLKKWRASKHRTKGGKRRRSSPRRRSSSPRRRRRSNSPSSPRRRRCSPRRRRCSPRRRKDEDWWKIYGQVISPKTHKPSRLGGSSAYKAILLLLKNSPKSQVHKNRIQYMAKKTTPWGRKMKKLLETHF
jgi:hypothetical protein